MANEEQLPVLIVGAGPVGLCLAVALAKQNINVVVFEKDAELNEEIRASTLHPASLELLDEWGVVDDVLAHGEKVDRLQYWERATRELIADFPYELIATDTQYPFRLQCPQHVLTRVLKPVVENSDYGQVIMSHELVEFIDHREYVEAVFDTPEGRKSYNGAYLCGTDGAKSYVRKQLDLSFDGVTYEDRFLLMGTNLDISELFPNAGPVCYMYDPEEWVIILNLPDIVRVVFRMRPEEKESEAMQMEAMRSRIDTFLGGQLDYEIKVTQVYRVHQRVAGSFRVGRVLLAGDAAHINNPAGGMGMNSGILDVANLVERLPKVMAGGDEGLLDEYSDQRKKYASDAVQSYTDKTYKDMVEKNKEARVSRNKEMAEIAADPEKARAYLLKASMLEHRI